MHISSYVAPSALVIAVATATTEGSSTAGASSLDDLDPLTCAALDAQLAKDSAAVVLFNSTSNAAISAFRAGRHDDGCRGFVAVRGYVLRLSERLKTCAAARAAAGNDAGSAEDRTLLAGFLDLREQLDRIDRREACGQASWVEAILAARPWAA